MGVVKYHITCVVVTYNCRQYLEKCLLSMRKHFTNDIDIIVVDNNSTDGTKQLLTYEYPQIIKILNSENNGYGAAANQGIKNAKTKYVLLLNADIEFIDDSILKLCDYMDQNDKIGLMGCSYLNTNGTMQYRGALKPRRNILFYMADALLGEYMPRKIKYLTDEAEISLIRKISMVQGACMMLRREAIENIGYFDDKLFLFGEEQDLAIRLENNKWDIYIDPSVKIIHHGSVSINTMHIRSFVEKHKAEYYVLKKHKGVVSAYLYRLLVLLKYFKHIFNKDEDQSKENKLIKWALGVKNNES